VRCWHRADLKRGVVQEGFAAAGYKATALELSKRSLPERGKPRASGGYRLAKKLSDRKMKIYATPDTADVVAMLG
jgi:hypothetical protein